jgi:hypothetical protein
MTYRLHDLVLRPCSWRTPSVASCTPCGMMDDL